jgi:hypothetical protein
VRIYELIAKRGASRTPEQEKAAKSYAAGLEAYRQKVWEEAVFLFGQALILCPDDGPSRTMAERCVIFQKSPPPEEWGVCSSRYSRSRSGVSKHCGVTAIRRPEGFP